MISSLRSFLSPLSLFFMVILSFFLVLIHLFRTDAKLPTSFKTHAGKTWRDMLGDTKAFRYIRWAAINLVGVPQQQAIGFIAFVEQIGGEKAALAKFGPK